MPPKKRKVFKYHIMGSRSGYPNRMPTAGPPFVQKMDEGLTGLIENWKASDIEERFYRALRKSPNVISNEFRTAEVAGRNLPGEVEVDFMVFDGQYRPIQIDGEYAHMSAQQREGDRMKDAILNNYTQGWAAPVVRIPGYQLQTQADADRIVKEMFG
jgi:hypothetical protein